MLRAVIAAAVLAAGGAAAQEMGSMEVVLGGEDRTYIVLGDEAETALEGGPGPRAVTLVAAPEDGGSPTERAEPEGTARLTLSFAVEGTGEDASVSEPRIAFVDEEGRRYLVREGMTATVSLTSFTEIGRSFALTGEFSAELAPEDGEGEPIGASGNFQATLETS